VRLGGWLFKYRTSLPLPIAAALLLIPSQTKALLWVWLGLALVVGGELLRLWGVGHIGVISRTRSDRTGPLVTSGPFALVRNPLYLGNIALWTGFTFSARLPWLAPVVAALLAAEYHAIVLWEEQLLSSRIAGYAEYARRVNRWTPKGLPAPGASSELAASPAAPPFSWRQTLFSERGTLMAIVAGYLVLWIKSTI